MTQTICDGCGKPRKPYRYSRDGEYEQGLMFCFLCVKEDERAEGRALRAEVAELRQELANLNEAISAGEMG